MVHPLPTMKTVNKIKKKGMIYPQAQRYITKNTL